MKIDNRFSNKKIAVFVGYRTPSWYLLIDDLTKKLLEQNSRVQVFDVSGFTFPKQAVLKPKYKVIESNKRMNNFDLLHINQLYLTKIEDSVINSLKSMYRNTDLQSNAALKILRSKLLKQSSKLIYEIEDLLKKENFDLAFIPNGRFFHEVAITEVCKSKKVTTYFFEFFDGHEKEYFIADYPVHDRISLQNEFRSSLRSKDVSVASDWINERSNPKGNNPFAHKWNLPDLKKESTVDNLFFNSSTDEIGAFGPMWKQDSWENQYEAFNSLLSKIEILYPAEKNVLRVHPNLINKSRKMYKNEIKAIKQLKLNHPSLEVHWHHSNVNSYELIDKSKRVFVANSTAGLESSALGKNVWAVSASYYDESIDIRKIFDPQSLSRISLENWETDNNKALSFLEFILTRNYSISDSNYLQKKRTLSYLSKLLLSDLTASNLIRLLNLLSLKFTVDFRKVLLYQFGLFNKKKFPK